MPVINLRLVPQFSVSWRVLQSSHSEVVMICRFDFQVLRDKNKRIPTCRLEKQKSANTEEESWKIIVIHLNCIRDAVLHYPSSSRLSIDRSYFSRKNMLWAMHVSHISACSLEMGGWVGVGVGLKAGSLLALPYEQRLHFEAGAVCSPQRLAFSMVLTARMN